MTMGSMRQFKDRTGLDLWSTLINVWHAMDINRDAAILTRLKNVYEVCDFDTAAEVLHCLIKAENKNIPLEEIRDSMFRVGWIPVEIDGEMQQPWSYVLYKVALDVNQQFETENNKKKQHLTGT